MTATEPGHIPVLYKPVLDGLAVHPGGLYIDGTVGLGGHSRGIAERSAPDGRLLCLDRDPAAIAIARQNLAVFGGRITFAQTPFCDMAKVAVQSGFDQVDGILLDLGVSSMQLDSAERGFSFQSEGPLDMRMGPDCDYSAADIVNTWPEEEIARVIYEYGEERRSRRIASAIVKSRPFRTTAELASCVARVMPGGRIHPATRTFQGLRIAVNTELDQLTEVLPQAVSLLKPGGRLAVISFHSLEDRIVKQFIVRESQDCICPPHVPQCVCDHVATVERVTRKPIMADEAEIALNPRSRSSRLRIAARLSAPERGSK